MTEEIKIVMEALAQLGGEAKWAFIAWIGYKAFVVAVGAGVLLTIVTMIVRTVRIVDADTRAMQHISTILETRWYERDATIEKVRELKKKAA